MYIHNKEEALEALAAILALPERRTQIIQMSVKIMVCLDPEPRKFLVDCMATLIENGLEYMRQKRKEALEALQKDAPTAVIIVDSNRDDMLEAVGGAVDALRMANVAMEVFKDLRRQFPPWRVARAVIADEQKVRDAMIQGVRLQGNARSADLAPAYQEFMQLLEQTAPDWQESTPAIEALINDALLTPFRGEEDQGLADDPEVIFGIVAMSDERARLVLELLATERAEAQEYVTEVRKRLDVLQELQERQT
jgi:hypothetical protein